VLSACIIYIPGSAGNLLVRCISLDRTSVPYGLALTPEDKFKEYNNWNSINWISSEENLDIDYMTGKSDFFVHETANTKLIHRLHPDQFVDGARNLWTGDYQWKNIIIINPDNEKIIKDLARIKRTDLEHNNLFTEQMYLLQPLMNTATYVLNFTDMLDWNTFDEHVKNLCNILDVEYYNDYVKQLWDNWYKETIKLVELPK
jgi:hypothetical protein